MTRTTVAGMMSALQMQIDNCIASKNEEWLRRSRDKLKKLCADCLPSGSGIDCGTQVESISDAKIVLTCSFHHMNESGMYDGWTQHKITVTQGFYLGITLVISGRDRNEIKDYLADTYQYALSRTVEWSEESNRFLQID